MHLTNANKAFIITLLLTSIIVLLSYNFSVLKQNQRIAETFFELVPEDVIEEEKEETLDDILKSLDNVLATNKAYNTTKKYDDFEDEEFKSTIDKIRNRDSRTKTQETQSSNENSSKVSTQDSESFNSINDIIAKTSQEKSAPSKNSANKNTSINYSLVGREKEDIPIPIYLCEQHGKIVINITVDNNGDVIATSFNGASTTNNGCMVDHALEYARASKFDSSNKPQQIGTITFLFQGK